MTPTQQAVFDMLTGGVAGAALTALYFSRRYKAPPSQLETMNQNVAMSIIATAVLNRWGPDPDQVAALEDDVNETLDDAFPGGARISIEEVMDRE